jgi:hypothetical protein
MAEQQEILSKISTMIKEANKLTVEIQRLNRDIKQYRQRKKEIETQILLYMGNNAIPAMQYNDSTVILSETRMKKKPKKKEERIRDSLEIIRGWGVENPEELLQQLNDAKYGQDESVKVIKIRNNLQL